jgi:ribosomal protein S18 acetylase RimI-like enzyme
VRDLVPADLADLARIDRQHRWGTSGARRSGMLRSWLRPSDDALRLRLGAQIGGRLAGFLFGEVRAFEFGSEPCGWVFAVGVDRLHARRGVASALLAEACDRFRAAGVPTVRTMVQRDAVPLLSFFRSRGFVGGRYVQLELAEGEEP